MVAEGTIATGVEVERLELHMSINKRLPHWERLKLIEAWKKLAD